MRVGDIGGFAEAPDRCVPRIVYSVSQIFRGSSSDR